MTIQHADALPGIERIRQRFLEMLEDRLDSLEDAMVEFEFPGTGRASLSRAQWFCTRFPAQREHWASNDWAIPRVIAKMASSRI